jgi:serine/threonine-protein kinase
LSGIVATTATPQDTAHLRDRLRLFMQVMLVVDIGAHVSDLVTPMLVAELEPMEFPAYANVMRWATTVGLAVGWTVTRLARPGRLALIAIDTAATFGLVLVYAGISLSFQGWSDSSSNLIFGLFGIMMLLVVRASLVPSPVSRTVVIGVSAVVFHLVNASLVVVIEPAVMDGLTFMGGAFVVVTGVTSHVIYGLRREVRAALQLGQYTLEEKLGEGGMGSVYRARHAMLRRHAAIKLIKPELTGEGTRREQALQRFEREAQATAELKSPHTIELYDFGVSAEGAFYYVMELLDGINLEVAVSRFGPMPPDRVVFLLRQVCDSLAEAHAAGLVHRDIKPANIFLCRHGLRFDFIKVLDFGLVALGQELEHADPKLTAEGVAAGTPAYLAPEMVASRGAVDGRTDLYALGCVAYWLLAGRPPFERETAMATILAHVNDTPLPPSSASEIAIPAALEAVVLQCLEKKPDARPSSAGQLALSLEAATASGSWDQERAAKWWESHKPVRREPPATGREAAKVTKAF